MVFVANTPDQQNDKNSTQKITCVQELLRLQHIYEPDFRWVFLPYVAFRWNLLLADYLATARVEFSLSGNLAKVVADIQSKQASLFKLDSFHTYW